jgi:Tfp pilus assembly protein PilX
MTPTTATPATSATPEAGAPPAARRTPPPVARPGSRGRLLRRHGDEGVALISVLGMMMVLSLFLVTSLAFVLQNATGSRRNQDAKAALAAAEAGLEEYIARLNADSNYFVLGNTDTGNAAFSAGGRVVPGVNGLLTKYSYSVLSSPSDVTRDGALRIQVTGTSQPNSGSANVSRTITATLKPRGFLRYVYVSDVEVIDPTLTVDAVPWVTYNGSSYWNSGSFGTRYRYYGSKTQIQADCGRHYYDGRQTASYTASAATPVYVYDTTGNTTTQTITAGGTVAGYYSGQCGEIQWASNDVIHGPFHSNDGLQINGSVLFSDPLTETSWSNPPSASKRWWGTGTPSTSGYKPVYGASIPLPSGNSSLLQYVEPDVDGDTSTPAGPGCYYTGATRIIFTGNSMKVFSPYTTTAPSRCLDTSNRANEQTKSIPPVIYVDSLGTSCAAGSSSGVGYPKSGESTTVGTTTDYSCNRGTAYVSGSYDSQVTVAAKDDVVVTGDVTDADNQTTTNILGLIAGNYVWVYHPVNSLGNNVLTTGVYNIDAAILALRHSFLVQNWNQGSALSTSTATKLNVTGSIAQKYRGPVGTGNGVSASTGYLKNYVYDSRLLVLQPPYFLTPDASPWSVSKISDK